jgi:hypothetical protein
VRAVLQAGGAALTDEVEAVAVRDTWHEPEPPADGSTVAP